MRHIIDKITLNIGNLFLFVNHLNRISESEEDD